MCDLRYPKNGAILIDVWHCLNSDDFRILHKLIALNLCSQSLNVHFVWSFNALVLSIGFIQITFFPTYQRVIK